MAFPVVTKQCFVDDHEGCYKRPPKRVKGEFRAGGWFCVCPCHHPDGKVNMVFYDSVRAKGPFDAEAYEAVENA